MMEEEKAELLYMGISSLLSILLIVSMFGDLIGLNLFELTKMLITKPWIIPKDIVERYYPLWYGMEWLLLITMVADQVYTMRYYSTNKEYPPIGYVRWVSLIMLFLSFWLAVLFHSLTFVLITILSASSFVYTFMKKEEET
ncbi:MAG: hypothetical protein ACP5IT_07835 [Thermoproteota archaeon]